MKTEKERTESLEEIVFRHRNKSYGAFRLRSDYKKIITAAMIFALFLTSAAITYPLVTAIYYKPKPKIEEEKISGIELKSPKDEEKIKPDVPEAPEPEIERVRFAPPVVVDSAVETVFGNQDLLADQTNTGVPDEHPDITVIEGKPVVIEQPVKEKPWIVVEIRPEFPGGEQSLMNYLATHLKYPEEAKELGIQGIVYINFVIEKDGSITEVKVMRGIGGGCDEVALQAVREMPRWTPGRQQGNMVRVSFNLPVRFTLH